MRNYMVIYNRAFKTQRYADPRSFRKLRHLKTDMLKKINEKGHTLGQAK